MTGIVKSTLLPVFLFATIQTLATSFPPGLEKKFPKAKSSLSFIGRFPALAVLLASDAPWELSPDKLVARLFPSHMALAQGSRSYPLLYNGKRTVQWPGVPVWDQFAYETEYYVFDPCRPVIRFHIGRPLDLPLQTLEHEQPADMKALYPLLADSVRALMTGYIRRVVEALKSYGARELPFRHPRIHEYLLPGNTRLTFSDFTGTGVGSVYLQIDLQPMSPVGALAGKRIPAFPGAEGYGAYTPGGRGGKLFIVTTLQDYLSHQRDGRPEGTLGENEEGRPRPVLPAYPALPAENVIHGSLREALEAHGPRTVVFAVSGTIELKDYLTITDPYLTVAGNTAPGEGVQIRNWGIVIRTHDVILRYLRVRVGDTKGPGNNPRVLGDQTHAIDISGINIIVDHCEFAYANDQLVNLYGEAPDQRLAVSFQWNFVYGGLSHSTHEKGSHSMSYFLTGWGYASFHHNLTAHSMRRNPRAWGEWLDYRNNVLYDYVDAGYGEAPDDYIKLNYIGNTQKRGSQTFAFIAKGPCGQYYAADNIFPPGFYPALRVPAETIMPVPFDASPVRTQSARGAYDSILLRGGASLPCRDSISRFIVESTRTGTGNTPGTTDDWPLGGYPVYASVMPLPDRDHDGMPDDWEIRYGLNPDDPTDAAKDKDRDGYTNLEEYINGTAPNQYVRYRYPDNNK